MLTTIEHHENGQIKSIEIIDETGVPHNPNGPAYQRWYATGQEEYREYWLNGEHHNPKGPAYRRWYTNGQEEYRVYWVHGKLHNPNGPAVQRWLENGQEECQEYWLNGKCHNPNGPAIQTWYENGQEKCREYWLNGVKITKEEFERYHNTVEVICNGKSVRISKESAKALDLT